MTRNRMRPIHPGEILREEFLVPLEMSAHALSQAIRVPATRVNDIVNSRRGITADTALRLARYFSNSPEFWLNLQAAYDLRAVEHEAAEEAAGGQARQRQRRRPLCVPPRHRFLPRTP